MVDQTYNILNGLGQEGLVRLVVAMLAVLFVLGLISEKFRRVAPALMTSLGILGTFCGIFVALHPLDFSAQEINNSVEALLNGMTIAFVTSLYGILAAIIFRVVSVPFSISLWSVLRRFAGIKPPVPEEQQKILEKLESIKQAIAGDGDSSMSTQIIKLRDENRDGFKKLDGLSETVRGAMLENLKSVATETQTIAGNQREILGKLGVIKQAIAEDGDSSITAQITKLRDENREGFKKLDGLSETIRGTLVESLTSLTAEIRDVIGRQLGESIRELIRNIEEALIRQFGQTFVQFNEATQALKKWQEDHRSQVERLTAAFDTTAKGVGSIVEGCERIPQTMQKLQEVVGTAHLTVESLNRQVEAFAGMRQQAEESFPVIKRHLDKIGEDLAASAKSFDGLEATIQAAFSNMEHESKAVAERHAQTMRDMVASMNETFQHAEQETRNIAQQHSENVMHIVANMSQTLENAQSDSAAKVAGIVEKATERFSQEMEKEIFRVAQAWGENLVSIATTAKDAIESAKKARE